MKTKHRFLYKTVHIPTGRYYVGVHETSNIDDGYMGSGVVIQNLLKSHPREEFRREILCFCDTRKELTEKERETISEYYDDILNLNIALGGDGGDVYASLKLSDPEKYAELASKRAANGQKAIAERRAADPAYREARSLQAKKALELAQKASLSEASRQKRLESFKKRGHQQGSKNSQFGKMWITNGVESVCVPKEENLPPGWRKGRVLKRKEDKA